MQVAIELMWPGVPVTAWAIMLPRRSKTPAERSPDSRTTVVNEVRIRAAACSLTTAISRFQRTSRVIGSMVVRAVIVVPASFQSQSPRVPGEPEKDPDPGGDADDDHRGIHQLRDVHAGEVLHQEVEPDDREHDQCLNADLLHAPPPPSRPLLR